MTLLDDTDTELDDAGVPAVAEPDRTDRRRPLRRPSRSGWITGAIGGLAAFVYLWDLDRVGYANSYYTAAVKSATVSWKAFFFGSIDPGNFITVDKPPAALWLQALSGRIFGFSTWSMLVPEALCGVATVLLLHHMVRKWAGDTSAHLAALALTFTPVAVLMFRYNNPDAFLTFLCVAAAAALWKAVESSRTRWLVLSGALVGLAFQTKMLQAFLILPAFIAVYLWAGTPRLRTRIAQLVAALLSLIVSAGWWVAIVALWPAATRPYIGSTSDNSILSLVFGYNGLNRIFGGSSGNGGPGGGGPGGGGNTSVGFGGASGIGRMFNVANGGQISWLLPLAGAGLLAGLWLTRRHRRTSLGRAGWVLWGGWAVVSLVVFSLSSGIFHQYYTVQVAPAVAALAGAGAVALHRLGRRNRWLRGLLPAVVIVSAAWAVVLLARDGSYDSWLRPVIMVGAAFAAMGLWLGAELRHKPMELAAAALAAVVLLAGPIAYTVTSIRHPASGSIVAAGPGSTGGGPAGFGAGGGMGGGSAVDRTLISYLESHQGSATYLVAGFGSGSTESLIIATGKPVMTIGGFSGSDPAPTLAQFRAMVRSGAVRYVLIGGQGGGPGGGGFGGGPGGNGAASSISAWVTAHGTTVNYGGTGSTLYDVSAAA